MTVGKIENAALQTQQTKDEIKFIRGIGRQKVPATAGVPRAGLLRGYLAGCQKREQWDGIDRARVMAFAEAELAKVGASNTARPPTPTGWSDTNWLKHLQEQHPLSGLHINQGSMDAAADAYEAEYNAAKEKQ